MIAKEDILSLKAKILPAGADQILDYLVARHQQVELTHIVLENVPLLIIGRHGMIARIPVNGVLQKVSQPAGILELLHAFFQKQETLYLFINLPDIPVPSEVTQVLQEVQARALRKEELRRLIDRALDERDEALFYQASEEWRKLTSSDN
ncbi:IDEAL domain-containing protein [Alicyclobacillus cycloheptanicus]|jgi:hypothetical protein|uniref:IDEAL domain-containing protein n=1 Tax=Alicyclobacillus cycloheptanicus TaxID=1457 RepID=A0ABT9XLP8_9BACL|nr:IDEAL domain-containing protein [Alicyclobacillus cycloheptanicus]MDQ0191232.1 hypothetical protein [Alicyclobacillus cycloheptanicus]WDM01532.1 IDEAL domain-containing protein [Alicyclobacillus cycloheptanicus]